MTLLALLAALVAIFNLVLYIRANNKLKVLRTDVQALAQFAQQMVGHK